MGRKSSSKQGKKKSRDDSSSLSEITQGEQKRESKGRMWYLLLVAVVGIVILISYFNSFSNQFVFDRRGVFRWVANVLQV